MYKTVDTHNAVKGMSCFHLVCSGACPSLLLSVSLVSQTSGSMEILHRPAGSRWSCIHADTSCDLDTEQRETPKRTESTTRLPCSRLKSSRRVWFSNSSSVPEVKYSGRGTSSTCVTSPLSGSRSFCSSERLLTCPQWTVNIQPLKKHRWTL